MKVYKKKRKIEESSKEGSGRDGKHVFSFTQPKIDVSPDHATKRNIRISGILL